MERDRLKKKLKKKAVRNTILVMLGIIVLGIVFFMYGTQMLIGFSLLLAKDSNETTTNTTQGVNYIPAPDLDPLTSATNSAKITVSGSASIDDAEVKIYVNGVLEGTEKTNDKNEFTFDRVPLEEGDNEIKAKIINKDGKESSYSSPLSIRFSNKAPDLTIEYPNDGQTLKQKQQRLAGKTEAGAKVTVNGTWVVTESDGSFSYSLSLNDGENTIKVSSTDPAGNRTDKEIKVTYSP